tara:strand:+ start:2228 stop:3070 length:843 start_codon:yes stop_codon:yes gene_type:complete
MNVLDFFLLQMSDKDNQLAARSLEMNFRCLTGPKGFDNAIKRIERDFPGRLAHDWVKPLLDAIRPFYVPYDDDDMDELLEHENPQVREAAMQVKINNARADDDFVNPLNAFLEAMMKKLNGGRAFFVGKNFNLDNFTAEELALPYMQWITLFANRYNQLKAEGYNKKIMRLCRIHPCENISDEFASELAQMFEDDDWFIGMDFNQFVNWYVKSRAHFTVENETLEPEMAERMTKTLNVWHEGKGKKLSDHLYWLSRNYEFHPVHKPYLSKFIAETLNISE